MKRKRAVSWVAVSSKPQFEKESPDEQRKENRAAADRIGAEIIAVLEVPGQSREYNEYTEAEANIAAYRQLREMLKAGAVDLLIARDMSRLGRRSALAQQVVGICHAAGCAVYLRSSPPQSLEASEQAMSLGSQITYGIEGLFAQIEMINLRKRHEFGMTARIRSGRMPGKPPFGYREVDGRYVVDTSEAAQIRRIYELYLNEGKSFRKISGITAITESSVRYIIERAWTYAGFAEWHSPTQGYIRAPGTWEAIISEVTAQAADDERLRRSMARRSVTSPAIFSGVLFCDLCGGRLISEGFPKRSHGVSRTERTYKCKGEHIRVEIGEGAVLWHCKVYYGYISTSVAVDDLFAQIDTAERSVNVAISNAEAALIDLSKRRDRLTKAYTEGIIDIAEYQEPMAALRAQVRRAESELDRLRTQLVNVDAAQRQSRIEETIRDGLAIFDNPDVQIVNAWLRRHYEIWVGRENAIRFVQK